MAERPYIIGMAGPSASGKTTIARALAERLGDRALVLSCDGYYRDLSHLSMAEREQVNFDHPDAIEHELLAAHLAKLRRGEAVEDAPTYSFETHTRLTETARLEPRPAIIVEGLYVLHWPDVRGLLDLRVYLDASHEVCLARRIERDVRERGRTEEFCREQYERTVRPMAEEFIAPSQTHADLTLGGVGAIKQVAEWIVEAMGDRWC